MLKFLFFKGYKLFWFILRIYKCCDFLLFEVGDRNFYLIVVFVFFFSFSFCVFVVILGGCRGLFGKWKIIEINNSMVKLYFVNFKRILDI